MAETAVSTVVGTIGDLLIQEAKSLYGMSHKIELMQIELEMMQSYLEDADRRQIQDKRVQTWVSRIRETAYDADAVIETFLIKIASRRRAGIKNAFKRYACIINEAVELHELGSKIEEIKTKISLLTRCLETYGIKHSREDEEGPSSVVECQRQWRQSHSHEVEEFTVGLDENIKILVEELVNEERECGVVSICGMGGLGKTTLAKKVYHHNDIKRHFDGLAWVFISQQFQPRNIWEGILFSLISPSQNERNEIKGLRDEEVAQKLYKVQQEGKYLVILDDIWNKEAWDSLRHAFPVGKSGSKILLTTRNEEVLVHVDSRGFLHKLRLLTEEEGWVLLQKKAFPFSDLSIEWLKGNSKPDEWTTDMLQTGDIVEELKIGSSAPLRSPFKNGKAGVQKLLHNSLKNGETSIQVRICRGSNEFAELQACIVPNESAGKEQYMLRVIGDPNYADGLFDQMESECFVLQDHRIDEDMKELGKKMVEKCQGLPLAIVVLGGLLATKNTYEWKMVYENINSYLGSSKRHEQQRLGVFEILALGYHELPYQLKPCFLHLGHFPEGFNIPIKKLVRLWVADGLVSQMQYEVEGLETLEDVAECYIEELLNRNMVHVGERGSTGRVKTCQLHDLMRDMCLLMAKKKNFLEIYQDEPMVGSLSSTVTISKLSHRIAVLCEGDVEKIISWKSERTPYLRSLLFFSTCKYGQNFEKMTFWEFKSLRVLDLEICYIKLLPKKIGNLIHLRCLILSFNIGGSSTIKIPSSIGNLMCLQTLIIKSDRVEADFEVPNVIWKMERLRHLYLPLGIKKKSWSKLGLGDLKELQTLQNFDARVFDVTELNKCTNLKKLGIRGLNRFQELERVLVSPSVSKNRLCSLQIKFDSTIEETDLQGLFSSCHQLCKLVLNGPISKLPEYLKFPQNLTKLTLKNSKLEINPMEALEKLPNLSVLRLLRGSFMGKQMIYSAKGFPQLKSLQLHDLFHLAEWRVDEEAMPNLRELEIDYCLKLKMVPDGLRFITTLQEFHIISMRKEFENRVKEGGEDYDKVKHVPSIIFK